MAAFVIGRSRETYLYWLSVIFALPPKRYVSPAASNSSTTTLRKALIVTEKKKLDYCFGNCNRCGGYKSCSRHDCWPAGDGSYYGRLCTDCRFMLNNPEEWEKQRLELVGRHSE